MLLTRTTEMGIQGLVYMADLPAERLVRPPELAERFGTSPTYLAKILSTLARADILLSYRGPAGGFKLAREPESIGLLEVVEALQGSVAGNYCQPRSKEEIAKTCGFHQSMWELEDAVRKVLSAWTIGRIAAQPTPPPSLTPFCKLRGLREAAARVASRTP